MSFVFTRNNKNKEKSLAKVETLIEYVSTHDPSVEVTEFRTFDNIVAHDKITNKNTSFALFSSNFSELYIKIIEPGEEFNGLSDFKKHAWKRCYVFTHKNIDFSNGKDLVFKNQLIKLLKQTGHKVRNDFDVQDVNSSNVMRISEIERYEKFWKNVLKVLYSGSAKTVGWSLFNKKDQMLEKKLFNNDSSRNSNSNLTYIDAKNLPSLMNVSENSIVKYTLEDELGNVNTDVNIHQVMLKWLKSLYEIDSYKDKILEVVRNQPNWLDRADGLRKNIIFTYADSKNYNDIIGYDEEDYRYIMLNSAKSWGQNAYGRSVIEKYLTTHDLKRHLMFLSAVLGIRINLKEEIVQDFPTYDEDFSERIKEENKLRNSNFVELFKLLEAEEMKDKEFLKYFLDPFVKHDKNSDSSSDSVSNMENLKLDKVRSKSMVNDFDNVIEDLNNFDSSRVFKGVFEN